MTVAPSKPKGMKPELWDLMLEHYRDGYRSVGDMTVQLLADARNEKLLRAEIPPERAMYRHIGRLNSFFTSEPVGLKDIPVEHSATVFAVLSAVVEETQGRVHVFTRAEVDWIIRVHAAAWGELTPWQTYAYAREYWARELAGENTVSLDLTLAHFKPWRPGGPDAIRDAAFAGWLPVGSYHGPYPGRMFVGAAEATTIKAGERIIEDSTDTTDGNDGTWATLAVRPEEAQNDSQG